MWENNGRLWKRDGEGPHAALLVAAQEKPFQQATQYLRSKGVLVCIGLPAGAQLSAPVFDTVIRMITIKGSYVGNRADTAEALDFFRRGLITVPFKTIGLSHLTTNNLQDKEAPQTQTKLVKPRRTIQTYEPKAPSQHHATRFSCSYPGFDQRAEGVQVPPITCSASQAGPQN